MIVKTTIERGSAMRLGRVFFHEDKLLFFAGYSKCSHCVQRGKVLMSKSEVEDLSKALGFYDTRGVDRFKRYLMSKLSE